MEELVSIVLPVYNGEKYLRESIESILAQTWKNWELIIVDDCSKDHTSEIALEYVEMDRRIQYYRNEKNLRLPRNLNRGFSLTKGQFLTWTSDDNLYLPNAIFCMVERLKKSKAEFVFTSCRVIDADGKDIEYMMVDKRSIKRIVGENPVGACFMYTRKVYEAIGEYDPDYTLVEDIDYWQRIASRFKTVCISDILYKYRWHDGALTSTMRKDTYNRTLEKMILKNKQLFEPLDWEQKYYLYRGLSRIRINLGEKNPYKVQEQYYSLLNLILYRIPNRIIKKVRKVKYGYVKI